LQKVSLHESAARLQDLQSFRFNLKLKIDLGDIRITTGNDDADALATAFLSAFGDIEAAGAYVAPDRAQVSATLGGQQFDYVKIGDESWQNFGNGWQEGDFASGLFQIEPGPTSVFADLLPQEALDVASTRREKVNGVDATRYSFDKDALSQVATEMGHKMSSFSDTDSVDVNIWLSDDGVPVKLTLDISGTNDSGQKVSLSAELNVTDINSGSVQIERPA
jgi:hypothetical protein